MKWIKRLLFLIFVLIIVLLIAPFFLTIPALENTKPVDELVDSDSEFVKLGGLDVHYKQRGDGSPVIILLHGYGASTFSWRSVMKPLADYGKVIAYDRPAFGLTERPLPGDWQGDSPYSLDSQTSLLLALMDEMKIKKAILVGNSAGGTVALNAALKHPDRVQGLVLVDAAIFVDKQKPQWQQFIMKLPQLRRVGPLFIRSIENKGDDLLRSAWHDPEKVTSEILEGYRKPLQANNWDKALWEYTIVSGASNLQNRLGEVNVPALVISGDDDQIIPLDDSLRLAQSIPGARAKVMYACGHVPQDECPDQFMIALGDFIDQVVK
jgi:pimeloyl-ACP methyl ester carboxylesterase